MDKIYLKKKDVNGKEKLSITKSIENLMVKNAFFNDKKSDFFNGFKKIDEVKDY